MNTVDHPKHYQQVSEIGRPILIALGVSEDLLELECLDAIDELEDNGWSFARLNAVKYLWRCGLKKKNATEDLEKAKWYLERWLSKNHELHRVLKSLSLPTKAAIDLIDKALEARS
ncbi:MAG: DUF3310 domain-containing protein [Chroococcidiopsis sp.]